MLSGILFLTLGVFGDSSMAMSAASRQAFILDQNSCKAGHPRADDPHGEGFNRCMTNRYGYTLKPSKGCKIGSLSARCYLSRD